MTGQTADNTPVRKLTPTQVADRLGVGVRAVQKWVTAEAAPATRVGRGRNERLYLNLDEFAAWCNANAKTIRQPGAVGEAVVADLGGDLPLLGASAPADAGELIETLRRQIATMTRKIGTSEVAEQQKLASSIEKLSQELRRLEADERDRLRDAGVYMLRSAAESVLVSVARRVRETVQALPDAVAGEVLAAVTERQVAQVADRNAFERVVASTLTGVVERVLASVASDVEGADQDLARAG